MDALAAALRHFKHKQFTAAEGILAIVPPDSEEYPRAIKLMARCAFGRRDFPTAEAAARRAIEVVGEDGEVLLILATVLRYRHKFAEAAANYRRILEVSPEGSDQSSIYLLLARCLVVDKNHDRAEAVLREAVLRFPQAALYAGLAELRLKLRDRKEALELATTALSLDADNLKARGIISLLRRKAPKAGGIKGLLRRNAHKAKGLASLLRRDTPVPSRRARWMPFPGHYSQFEDARRVIKSSLLRGYPKGEAFITDQTKFLTLGSCFASSLAKALRARGMEAFTEFIGEDVNSTYANLAFLNWVENGVQDETGALMQEAYGDGVRERYLKAAQECEVFVFTLGLAAAFFDKTTGNFFFKSLAGGGPEKSLLIKYEMRTTTVAENVDNLREIIGTIRRLSRKQVTTVLTVSPVPLAATSEMDSAVIADCLSKSTLRLACEEVRASDTGGRLHYWPSFEIVRWLGPYFSAHHPPVYGMEDRKTRHVSRWIVSLIVDLFIETYSSEQAGVEEGVTATAAE